MFLLLVNYLCMGGGEAGAIILNLSINFCVEFLNRKIFYYGAVILQYIIFSFYFHFCISFTVKFECLLLGTGT